MGIKRVIPTRVGKMASKCLLLLLLRRRGKVGLTASQFENKLGSKKQFLCMRVLFCLLKTIEAAKWPLHYITGFFVFMLNIKTNN